MAAVGMYLLCMTESLRLGAGDIMVFLCAIAFAIQIMTVDHYAARIDGAVVSCIQFTVCGVVCCIGALIWGQPTFGQLQEGLGALLYAGVLSCGVGYTLQIVGQKGLNPTVAALIMSLESVIATISGWIAYKIGFLTTDQTLTARQIAGCVIVFAAVILVQLPPEWFLFWQKECINKECIILRKSAETVLRQIVRGNAENGLYQCFLGGRPDLCFGADINGKTKMMPGRIMVLLVVTGAVISALGWYEPFQNYAGAGASVPLLGFGNVLMKGVKEAVQEQGF